MYWDWATKWKNRKTILDTRVMNVCRPVNNYSFFWYFHPSGEKVRENFLVYFFRVKSNINSRFLLKQRFGGWKITLSLFFIKIQHDCVSTSHLIKWLLVCNFLYLLLLKSIRLQNNSDSSPYFFNFSDDKTLHYDDSDEFLQLILRPVKYYPESAHKLVKNIFHFSFTPIF